MAILIFLLIYLVGFTLPLFARSWHALGATLLACSALVVGAIYWARSGDGLIVLAFSFPIIFFAAGVLAGILTKAVLLHKRWPNSAIIGLMRRGGWPKQAEAIVNKFEIILNEYWQRLDTVERFY